MDKWVDGAIYHSLSKCHVLTAVQTASRDLIESFPGLPTVAVKEICVGGVIYSRLPS